MKNAHLKIILPIIILFLGILCFKNGVVVADRPELTNESIGILFFHIISLFSFGAKDYGAPVSGPIFFQYILYLIYFLAPIISISALTEILYLISKPIIPSFLFNKDYYIILGYGSVGKSAENAIKEQMGANAKILIIDKDVTTSSLGAKLILGWNKIFISTDLEDHFKLDFINLSKCKSIFIITDNEWINLKIFQQIKKDKHIQENTKIYTHINNLDIIEFLDSNNTEIQNKNDYFFNVYSATAQIFFLNKGLDNELSSERHLFKDWLHEKIDTFVILGFGNFGNAFLHELTKCNEFTHCKTLIIVDNNAENLWQNYIHDFGWKSNTKIITCDSNLSNATNYNSIFNNTSPKNACAVFCSNDETLNLKAATSFHKLHKQNKNFKYIIKTSHSNSFSIELIIKCLGEHYIKIPTYDWIKFYFKENLFKN